MSTHEEFRLSIGNRVTVGHRVVLHGCTVEDDALIGIGAIVLNGAHIGQGSIVAAARWCRREWMCRRIRSRWAFPPKFAAK